MKLKQLIEPTLLDEMIKGGFISERKHPTAPLRILNYTHKAQFDRVWNDATRQCRGLIVNDETGDVMARPFHKFFNLDEEEVDLPAEDFEVTEKMDGSLGILYRTPDDVAHIASRGSFDSEQAKMGTRILRGYIARNQTNFIDGVTYLFEIIYPQNRIVVNYGDVQCLVMLAVIDNETGRDLTLPDWYQHRVKVYSGVKDVQELKKHEDDNREGYCIRYANGLRLKIKLHEYVRLHRIVTNISARHIWDYLRRNEPLDEILDRVPDEFYEWVKKTQKDLKQRYAFIEQDCKEIFAERPKDADRREIADYFNGHDFPAILFKMLDDKPYEELIWKEIKPAATIPFKEDVDS